MEEGERKQRKIERDRKKKQKREIGEVKEIKGKVRCWAMGTEKVKINVFYSMSETW